jgi:hypothetical protein
MTKEGTNVEMNMDNEPERKVSKRGRRGEGRPTKRTPEVVAKIAQAIAQGLTDREAGLLAGVRQAVSNHGNSLPLVGADVSPQSGKQVANQFS